MAPASRTVVIDVEPALRGRLSSVSSHAISAPLGLTGLQEPRSLERAIIAWRSPKAGSAPPLEEAAEKHSGAGRGCERATRGDALIARYCAPP